MTASLVRAARRIRFSLRSLLADRVGATLFEYIMLAGLIAITAIAGFTLFGGNVAKKITAQAAKVTAITE